MEVVEILKKAIDQNASDIFFVAGSPCMFKVGQQLVKVTQEKMMPMIQRILFNSCMVLPPIVHMKILWQMEKMIFLFLYPRLVVSV